MTTLAFGTKADTLARLAPHLRAARILPLAVVEAAAWRQHPTAFLEQVAAQPWGAGPLIVRSSARCEDAATASLAGKFLSLAGVRGPAALEQAVEAVIASFGPHPDPADQVLVQPMLNAVSLSGVAFGRDPNSGAPYIVINYDDTGDTAAVTAGKTARLATYVHHSCAPPPAGDLGRVVALMNELAALFADDRLDVEFAFSDGDPVLLQVRPLAACAHQRAVAKAEHRKWLAGIAAKVACTNRPHPFLLGKRTVLGVMPDWNPAEIIGVRPRPLALSLYRVLVTDSIWAYQRHNYGYRNLRSFPLMLSFEGQPYIDVRVSFNSFLPQDLPPELGERMVDHYIERLIAAPSLHDKVEFEIVYSCYTLDLPQRLEPLAEHGFSAADRDAIADSLRRLTNRIIRPDGLWRRDEERVAVLEERQRALLKCDINAVSRIYWLLEDCKRYGTLPFAGLARAGFIAVQMLRSLVALGILERRQYDSFMTGVDTVSATLGRDFHRLSRATFLAKYGHLRPGTYDILSPRYDEAPERYFDWSKAGSAPPPEEPPFALSLAQMRRVAALLAEHGLEADVVGLFDFIQASIRGREYAKFVFTRSLSDALTMMAWLGQDHGFSPEDVSYADIGCIPQLYASSDDAGQLLRHSIARGREAYRRTCAVLLPPLIGAPDDVWCFAVPACEPNFVTQKQADGPVREIGDANQDLSGAIVVIPSADPGFDWLFSRGIAGLVTAYGGINSHMAIRAGELGLPAVIGAGEAAFQTWRRAQRLRVDCCNRRVEVLA